MTPAARAVAHAAVVHSVYVPAANLSGGELPMRTIPNVLVLSAGGYGHVPIPLFIRPVGENRATPVAKRPYLIS